MRFRAVFFDVGETLLDETSNDVPPAVEAGMAGIFLRRGPWGWLHAAKPEASEATARIDSLDELPDVLERL